MIRCHLPVSPRRARSPAPFVLLAASALVASAARAELPADCAALGDALAQHSCFHVLHGPSETVVATPGSALDDATAAVDPVHTQFRIVLPVTDGPNVVSYTPQRTGAWVVFLDRSAPVGVFGSAPGALPALLTQTGETGCAALPEAHVFDLEEDRRYRLVLGPEPTGQVQIIVEYLEDFLAKNGADVDGDGWGSSADFVVTACQPPDGHAPNAQDCDDADPAVNPGATESCDGVDQNCNGVPDDVGLTCRVGVGACLREGKWSCDGLVAACSAEPGTPLPETCDNEDEDCDGAVDEQVTCADPAAPLCVRDGFAAACGCLADVDCGSDDSGRVCDPSSRTCQDGCAQGPARNGCPGGQECSVSGDDEGIGTCDAPGASEEPASRAGCGCVIGAAPSSSTAPLAALALALAVVVRRGRGRGRSLLASCAFATLVLSAVASGCVGTVDVDADEACVTELGSALTEHACSHGTYGPFESVVPSPDVDASPSVDAIHVAYTLDFPPGQEVRWVSYTPSRDGDHVLFTGAVGVAHVIDADDASVALRPARLAGPCAAFRSARVVGLKQGWTYALAFDPSTEESTLLFIEHLGTFAEGRADEACP